jgi:hypothetical protein
MLNFKKDDMNFQLAKDLYNIGEMSDETYCSYLADEMARNRTIK